MGYGNGSIMFENIKKTIDDSMDNLNPFEEVSSDTGSILPEHVDQFILTHLKKFQVIQDLYCLNT